MNTTCDGLVAHSVPDDVMDTRTDPEASARGASSFTWYDIDCASLMVTSARAALLVSWRSTSACVDVSATVTTRDAVRPLYLGSALSP